MNRFDLSSSGRTVTLLSALALPTAVLFFALATEPGFGTRPHAVIATGTLRIESIGIQSDQVRLKVIGGEDRSYIVQYSEDLEFWMSVSTNRLLETGVIAIAQKGTGAGFYRLLQLEAASGVEVVSMPIGSALAQSTNSPPTVDITSPANGSTFSSPASVLLSATAADGDSTVDRVEFYAGWNLVGVDSTNPYDFNWSNVVAGPYMISAIAVDNQGMRGTSAPVNVSVVSEFLSVEDAHVRGGKNATLNYGSDNPIEIQTVNRSAGNRDGYVKFDVGSISNVSSAKLRISAMLSRADSVETTAYSTGTNWLEDTINWDNRPALGPALGVVNINTTTNAWYELDVTGYVLSELSAGRSVLALAFHNESNSRATILANSRESGSAVPALLLTVTNNTPRVSITSPVDGEVIEPGADILVNSVAQTPSGTISSVEYFDGVKSLGIAAIPPYGLNWNAAATGTHTLTAKVVDSRGYVATSGVVNVTVDHAPTVSITSPADGSVHVAPALIPFSASASDSDGTITQVEFFEGGNSLGVVDSAPYNLNWINVGGGFYEIVARATDDLGVVSTSDPVGLTVYEPPVIFSDPVSQVAAVGGSAVFDVAVDGAPPLGYQWRLDGNLLPGQTATNLVLTNLHASDFGLVDVVVTNAYGSVISASAELHRSVIVGWGYSSSGQINVHPWMTNEIVAIDAGFAFNVALLGNGTVNAWGDNSLGQLAVPSDLVDVVNISAGEAHSLALRSDGTVVGWGSDNFGASTPPVGLTNVIAIETGRSRSVVLRSDGTVVAWGWDDFGQSTVPNGLSDVVEISSHGDHTLALRQDGTVVAWGWNEYGQADVPPGLSNVVAISAGALNSLVLKGDGIFVGWGFNSHGMLDVPVGLTNVVDFELGTDHSVALLSDGTVVRWGGNPTYSSDAPVPVGLTNVFAIGAGHYHSIALMSNGENLRPTVHITSPPGNQTFAGPLELTITAEASDWDGSVAAVEFHADGVLLGIDATAPYSFVWNDVVIGTHSLTATARDDQGEIRESSPVSVFVTSAISAVADAHVRDGSYASLNFGTEQLLEVQTRSTGQNRETYFKFDLTGVTHLTGATLSVFGALSGNGGVDATVYSVADTNWTETSITWSTRPSVGNALDTKTISGRTFGWHDFDVGSFVRAEKSAGRDIIGLALRNIETSRKYVQIHSREALSNPPMLILSNTNKAPSVGIATPVDNEQFAAGDHVAISVVATDSDGFIDQVEYFANGISLGVDTTEPYEFVWLNAGEGGHQLTAMATDDIGASAASRVVTIFVTAEPQVLLTSPANNAAYLEPAEIALSVLTSGMAAPVSKVDYYANGDLVALVTNSPFAGSWLDVAAGDYSIFARATDGLGATTDSDIVQVTVYPEALQSVLPGRLGYWRFEDADWLGEEGQAPVSFTNILNVADETHVALKIDSGSDAHLRYRDVEEDHRPNMDVRSGSVVFAFNPNWSSVGNGGAGPGGTGQFLSVGQRTEDSSVGCWNISIDAEGNEFSFVTQSNSSGVTNLVAPVSLSSNVWYQIALTYTSSNSIVYVNGTQVGTNGLGVTHYPAALVRAHYGLNVGSDHTGTEQIRGRIDDLETFNHRLTLAEVQARPDSDSDRLPDGWELFHGLDPQDEGGDHGAFGNPDGDALLNIEEWLLGSDPNSVEVPISGNSVVRIYTPLEH